MCGIAGFLSLNRRNISQLESVAADMAFQMNRRGPDGQGVWADEAHGIALAHQRLAILDLSTAGNQPMHSACGRYVIVYNGEIYNHLTIRQELEAQNLRGIRGWRGHSDTETLLAAISAWGLTRALDKLVGMFAFALWDGHENSLILARDRFGEKPVYYGLNGNSFIFGSELKALRAYPGFEAEIDRDVLGVYFQRSVIPGPYSIYRGILKLPPGTWLKITVRDIIDKCLPNPVVYWSLHDVAAHGQRSLFMGSTAEASLELERLLKQSVRYQMISDVPLGAFLSGGIDSSIIVALMQAQSSRPVRTFTIGFDDARYDESVYARNIAQHIGTEHTEHCITSQDALAVIRQLPKAYDEPFADVSQIPTMLVSEFASSNVKVCLTGDGGDELFGGYNRHITGAQLWRTFECLPLKVRKFTANILRTIPASKIESGLNKFGRMIPNAWHKKMHAGNLQKIANILSSESSSVAYASLLSHWSDTRLVIGGHKNTVNDSSVLEALNVGSLEHQMMYQDTISYLPDDVLVKVDRAAMWASLETRVPMLDHRIVEFAWTLPLNMKVSDGVGKMVLRNVLNKYVDKSLVDRPKSGFGVPIGAWLSRSLKNWVEEMLDPAVIEKQGYLNAHLVRDKWSEHLSGRRDWSGQLWAILMFQAWINENI